MDTQRVSARVEGGADQLPRRRAHARRAGHRGRRRRLAPPQPRRGVPRRHRTSTLDPTDPDSDPPGRVGGRRLIPGAPMTTIDTRSATDVDADPTVDRTTGAGFVTAALQSAKRTILQFFRTPQLLMLGTVQGALFLFMFRYIFGGAINPGGGTRLRRLPRARLPRDRDPVARDAGRARASPRTPPPACTTGSARCRSHGRR